MNGDVADPYTTTIAGTWEHVFQVRVPQLLEKMEMEAKTVCQRLEKLVSIFFFLYTLACTHTHAHTTHITATRCFKKKKGSRNVEE